jgi:hypothetical protein
VNARAALLLASGLVIAIANDACRSQTGEGHAPPRAAVSSRTSTLPEDPEAGARSVAEWRQHLEHEERERRLQYDRRKLPQHREVIRTLLAVRQRYDSATIRVGVLTAQKKEMALRPELEKSLETIDHWGVNSKVLPEYKSLMDIFSEAYPSARIEALSGKKDSFVALQRDVATRFETINDWLREAAESEDE